jgi:hypothetical protein
MNSTTFNTAMTTRTKGVKPGFNRWVRLVVALVLGVPVAVGAIQALPVAATGATFVPRTAFVIDGNPAGPNDFDAGYGPGVTPDGLATTGLYYNHRSVDQGGVSGCSLAADDTALGGTKISDGPVWPSGGPNPNGKTDINWVDIAAEKVDVNGQINDVLYVGYEKCGGNGTWQAMLYLDDGDGLPPTGGDLNGDYLFVFERCRHDRDASLDRRRMDSAGDAGVGDRRFCCVGLRRGGAQPDTTRDRVGVDVSGCQCEWSGGCDHGWRFEFGGQGSGAGSAVVDLELWCARCQQGVESGGCQFGCFVPLCG